MPSLDDGYRGIPAGMSFVHLCPPAAIAERHADRDAAIVTAYATRAYSYRQIAEHFGLHFVTVGRIVRPRLKT